MKKTINLFILILFITFISCNKKANTSISLKNAYKENFYIGVAINEGQILKQDSLETALIANEFNSITSENIMKSMFIHPTKDTFDFKLSDKYVAYGEEHTMLIHGHTLVWHSQLAPWFNDIKDSTDMTNALENHIKTIVTKYKGKIDSWDVVNEALNDDGSLRETVFLDKLGEDYLALAFKTAAISDPEADLYYNDYNMTNSDKRKGAIKLIKSIQKKGIKIDGVGMQGHWHLGSPSLEEIEKSILEYASLDIKIAITELDINVLPSPWDVSGADVNQNFEGSKKMNPYPKSLPDSIQNKLAKRYNDIFKLFLKYQDKISRVTFWGLSDNQSWLNDWPIKGRTNYPLLFDRDYNPKRAYDSIISLRVKEQKQSTN
tara:strand:+ start:24661 stop:25788 length:1128 start_codon:yes stop_codon:yes gene_type:complete